MCEKREGVRVRRTEFHDNYVVGGSVATEGNNSRGVNSTLLDDLGMQPGREYLLTATEIEATWPVVKYRPSVFSQGVGGDYCGHCGQELAFIVGHCPYCHVRLVGEISQAEVAALLRREGGGA